MEKFLIVISENTENGYLVYLEDRDAKKVVLPNCDNLYNAFVFCAGLNAVLKKTSGEMPVVFDPKDTKGYYFKFGAVLKKTSGEMPVVFDPKDTKGHYFRWGKEVAGNFRNS